MWKASPSQFRSVLRPRPLIRPLTALSLALLCMPAFGADSGMATHLSAGATMGRVQANISLGFKVADGSQAPAGDAASGSPSSTAPAQGTPVQGALAQVAPSSGAMPGSRSIPTSIVQVPRQNPGFEKRHPRPRSLEDLGGRFEVAEGEQRTSFPLLKTAIEADVKGDLATVSVTQTFANPSRVPMHATYLFPLNEDAAVFDMVMRVGDEQVRAKIQQIDQAKKTFEQARSTGHSAALLTEHRPNMFTQDIANLMPGLPITVTLRYVQTVPKEDGAYALVLPLVVGPRYESDKGDGAADLPKDDLAPQSSREKGSSPKTQPGQWEVGGLPAYPPVMGLHLPTNIDPARVSIRIRLDGGMPVSDLHSDTHVVHAVARTAAEWDIGLAEGRTIDNRDFVLSYRLEGASTQAGLLAYRDARGGYFSLLIEPPAIPAARDITPREMVFVLDCSGSMDGLPIDTSKTFMRRSLQRLRATDTFRVIRFSDSATEFSRRALPATPENIQRAIAYVDSLQGEGGTEMTTGIRQALEAPTPDGALRLVVFLTDGYIGEESQVLGLIKQDLGAARLFALGVGNGVNRYLLSEMGHVGRGFTRFMSVDEDSEAVADELVKKLDAPVLTDIHINWGKLEVQDMAPDTVRDLFAGQSIRIQGRYLQPGTHDIQIEGLINGRPARLPLRVNLPAQSQDGQAVALVWARAAIARAMDELLAPSRDSSSRVDALTSYVTDLGLKFSLVTRWTAFVAVSEKVMNRDPALAQTLPVPVPMVDGVGEKAYGSNPAPMAAGSTGSSQFEGSSSPEPTLIGGLVVAGLAGLSAMRRRRRS